MKISYDNEIDTKYVSLKKGKVFKSESIEEWLIFDKNSKDEILGIEILDASKHLVSIQTDNGELVQILEIQPIETNFLNEVNGIANSNVTVDSRKNIEESFAAV